MPSRPISRVTQAHLYHADPEGSAAAFGPPAPAYGIAALKDEDDRRQIQTEEEHVFVTVLVLALHRDPSVWGTESRRVSTRRISAREAEAKRPINAWKPFGNGQRACIGRGFCHAWRRPLAIGHDPCERFKLIDNHRYQMVLKETLTIKAGWLQDQGAPGARTKERGRLCRSCRGYCDSEDCGSGRAKRGPATTRRLLVLYGSNLGSAEETCGPGSPISPRVNGFATKTCAAGRVRRQIAGAGAAC